MKTCRHKGSGFICLRNVAIILGSLIPAQRVYGSVRGIQAGIIQSGITDWWDRNYPFVILFLLVTIIASLLRKLELSRIRMNNNIKLAKLEAKKLREIDLIKSRFLANISHELKTPLSLISGPLEDIADKSSNEEIKSLLTIIKKNTDRLNTLINQLLDLSRLETSNYTLKLSKGGIKDLLKGVISTFSSAAGKKGITIFFSEHPSLKSLDLENNFYFDPDICEKIIFNLLSNAVKFTPNNGKIRVSACVNKRRGRDGSFIITIEDTGKGIPKDKLHLIYNRFYQVDDSVKRENEGFGVGLAYVKELVEVHKANISVMSKPGIGSVFKVRFSLGLSQYSEKVLVDSQPQEYTGKTDYMEKLSEGHTQKKSKPVVLIVENNADMRFYLNNSLQKQFNVIEAENGNAGIRLAEDTIPDLIICDIMMPGIDGFEYTKNIKTNFRTSHIPVIILTALTDQNYRIQGLETGADDYLTKPFSSKELNHRVKNLIDNRRKLRNSFGNNSVIKPGEILVTSRDSLFVKKLLKLVEDNIDNESFTVEDLAKAAGMSHSQLHRKLKAVLNQSAVQFIRSVKMYRAKDLLEKDAGNVSEIAYMVGFSDPGYFTKTFRTFFGLLPSMVKKKKDSVA